MKRIPIATIGILVVASASRPAKEPAHHPLVDAGRCGVCHIVAEDGEVTPDVRTPVNDTCYACHPSQDTDHPVDVPPSFEIATDLPLAPDGEMTCVTCHDPHQNRFDSRQWQPISLGKRFIRLFSRDASYHTYLLRQRNLHGELCFSCHREL